MASTKKGLYDPTFKKMKFCVGAADEMTEIDVLWIICYSKQHFGAD